ncbi:MAG: hypothetical protein K0S44_1986 [Bacteroidetes bacterium]|jgi:uncharacterized protein YjbI with pentapeptide repeats|nr:hypothetical protein [Bacteroidota bacterium]
MSNLIRENAIFDKIDFSVSPLKEGEYEACTFKNCNFSNSDLSNFIFTNCEFVGSNLSLAKLDNTSLKTVSFLNCKLLGLDFSYCNPFLLTFMFEACVMNMTSFHKLKMKATRFKDCELREADFTGTDLSLSNFKNCDLGNAIFINSVLEKVDFRTAFNFSIDPEVNRIKNAKFSRNGILGLLNKYNIEIE